ncbi:MAG TPA: alpha/beta hydrolase [Candidatus Binatia bacterium]|jgi:alpha-beta hydrolase superfamily lysophospholipase
MIRTTVLVAWLSLVASVAASFAQEVITLPTRPGVTQSYFLARAPQEPQAIAVLFPGGNGLVKLRSERGQIKFSPNNFVVRTRAELVKRGVVAAFVDAPSDFQSEGVNDDFRLGENHFKDISVVVSDLTKRFPGLPVFLIGTSRGTVSAAALGARFGSEISGVVLTSSLFRATPPRSNEPGIGLSRFDYGTIKVPLLFVHHVNDGCAFTPYADAARLANKYPLISVSGGKPPESGPCDPLSAHGYFGKESETIEQIVNWMLKKPYEADVK